jgi:hypothetical protein
MAQHDYIISIDSGSGVRGDINLALSAIASQNSGASEPDTKYTWMTWLDTSGTPVLKIWDGTAWVSLCTFDTTNGVLSVSGATRNISTITQSSHGFSAGDVLRFNGTSFEKAKSDTETNAQFVGVVESSQNTNAFNIVLGGIITGLSGLVAGQMYYLSQSTAGLLTATKPSTGLSVGVLIATSTTTGIVIPFCSKVVYTPQIFGNKIINGEMLIDQRNAGAAVTPAGSGYVVDRWCAGMNIASKLTFQQVADAPTGFKNSLRVTVASQYSPASGDTLSVYQIIEGFNVIDCGFGTATPATITLSLWVKSSVAGIYSCYFRNGSANRSYVGTIAVTTVWSKQTITLTADNTGTWLTDSGKGLQFGIDLGSGSSFNNPSGSWQANGNLRTSGSVTFVNQTAGATFNFTGVQIEVGSSATAFERVPIDRQLAACQRYYQCNSLIRMIQGYVQGSTTYAQSFMFPFMRVAPTVTTTFVAGSLFSTISNQNATNVSFLAYSYSTGTGNGYLDFSYKLDAEL